MPSTVNSFRPTLTQLQREVLEDIYDSGIGGWFTPMMIGARNQNHHCRVLKALHARGYVERTNRRASSIRSFRYRLTDAGRKRVQDDRLAGCVDSDE